MYLPIERVQQQEILNLSLCRREVRAVLDGRVSVLESAFIWHATPQGITHWAERQSGRVPLDDADRRYLRSLLEEG